MTRSFRPRQRGRSRHEFELVINLNTAKAHGRDDAACPRGQVGSAPNCSCGRWLLDELLLLRGAFRFQFGAFHELLGEQPKLIAAPSAAAPDKTYLSCRFISEQRSGNEVRALKQAGIDCEFRQQGGAETVVDHLYQCRKARCLEAFGETPVGETADCKRVVAQAVTILQ